MFFLSKVNYIINRISSYIRRNMQYIININSIKQLFYLWKFQNPKTNFKYLDGIEKIKTLPINSLKGLFYYKISSMKEQEIEVYLEYDDTLKQEKYWSQCETYITEIMNVLEVYLDNAKEAAMQSLKKYIIIEFTLEKKTIVISISNTYKGEVCLSKMGVPGFTTKGFKRGYGLLLVKQILNSNRFLTQKQEMNGIYFCQKLIIKNR